MAIQRRPVPAIDLSARADGEQRSVAMGSHADRDGIAVLRVEVTALTTALRVEDNPEARVALATIAQQVHLLQLRHDPSGTTCPAITHSNSVLVARYVD
jgi:hypothetical protein